MVRLKLQVAIEFMAVLGALLVLACSVAVLSAGNMNALGSLESEMEARGLLRMMASKINAAYLEGDGFRTSMEMPHTLSSKEYEASISGNHIFLEVGGVSYWRPVLTQNVTQGLLSPGMKILRNTGGMVVLVDA